MKKSSEYIAESVFNVNAHYTKLQSRTKILFFDCLKNNKSKEYFAKEVKKIWHDIDHRFMDNQIKKIQDIVWNNNVELALNKGRLVGKYQLDKKWVIDDEFFKIVPETQFREFERAFEKKVVQNYERSKKNINQVIDKEEYLQDKVESYDKQINQTISYFNNQGEAIRQVQLSTYLSMVHNTNLTRSAWNQTMSDADRLKADTFIIPYHPFSCIDCYRYQNRPLSKKEVEDIIGAEAEEHTGDIIHPNCKCTLSIYWDSFQIQNRKYEDWKVKDMYKLRQRVNSLTLEKSRIATDMKIQKALKNEEKYDKLNQRRNAINGNLRKLGDEVKEQGLKIQLTAINR